MKVAILTDTNSGITEKEASDRGIFVMPMPVIIGDEVFYEGQNLTEEQFYGSLKEGKTISTTQPSPGDLMEKWEELLDKGYEQIVYIPMSSGLSNSCHTAQGLAREFEDKVFVADVRRISVTLREAVMRAAELATEGKKAEDIRQTLEREAMQSSIYIAVNTMDYLKKGGRITASAAMIGTVLNIKPILTIQGGKLDAFSKARSIRKCELRMAEALQRDLQKRFPNAVGEQIRIGAAGTDLTEEEQEQWKTILGETFPGVEVYYNPLPASIAVHTGPGAVGVGLTIR